MDEHNVPLVKGGNGRTARSVDFGAKVTWWCLWAFLIVAVAVGVLA